jgi:hypothetical protein
VPKGRATSEVRPPSGGADTAVVRAGLPIVGLVVGAGVVGLVVWAAAQSGTLGFDFLAYHQAASRILNGERLYDVAVEQTGGFGLFYYPPPFAVVMLPFALIPGDVAVWLWVALSAAMVVVALGLMPVGRTVRGVVLLLAAVSWPVAYAIKLGQVGPLLLLLFAVAWRWLDRPVPLGLAGAIGTIVKLQPGIVLAWAVLTRRWLAVVVGGVALVVAAIVATVLTGGLATWTDFVAVIRNVSDPITTPHNFTPGAVAYQLGASEAVGALLQVVSSALVVVAVLYAALRLPASPSFLVAVIASQLLSPVLWDHYAMLLLLPVAYLLERRQWWAIAIPLLTSVLVLPFGLPAVLYPFAFWATLVGLLVVGHGEPRAVSRTSLAPITPDLRSA